MCMGIFHALFHLFYGKVVCFRSEAKCLSMADNTDAKIQTFIQELDAAKDNNGWLGFNRALQSNIRKTSDN